jgi:cytochrome c5
MSLSRRWVAALALVALGAEGCSSSSAPEPRDVVVKRAQTMSPSDTRLAGLYAQSCKACHTAPDSGAPLVGDRAAWEPRWAKGLPALLKSTVGGLNGMPAGGQCFACAQADFEALIRFLAGHEA